jgi:2-dehydrotetronate isomerase
MPRFSANLGFLWPDRPLPARIDAAAAAGFRAIEVHWPYDVPAPDLRAGCERNGVSLLALNTRLGDTARGDFGLAALPGRERDFDAAIDESIAYCLGSGARMIHTMAGVVAPEDRRKARETLLRNLERASAKAEKHGFTLLLEAINRRDKAGYFYSTVGEPAAIIAELGRPNVRLMFDVYHVGCAEGDVLKKLELHFPVIGHIQIAAVPSRAEPDEGEINYPNIFKAIDSLGYPGWIGAEYKPRGDTDQGLAWAKTLGVSL